MESIKVAVGRISASSWKAKVTAGALIGLGLLGLWIGVEGTSARCNAPELISEFQDRYKSHYDQMMARFQQTGLTDSIKQFKDYRLTIRSTTTLGQQGNLTLCSMSWDYGDPAWTKTFHYAVGRDDKGDLVWRFDGRPPYQITMFD